MTAVHVSRTSVVLPTYAPLPADKNPMFLEKRVYQGSSGKVYPLPFTDRVAETRTDRAWDAVHLENDFLQVMILPEIGGRIHAARDKLNGYDFIYRQNVIKPALVGLAGPWISGGIEFNWPQHHRPSTFMPADVFIEEHADGAKTVWLGEHDPMQRMKGMHGVCLHPDRAVIELKVRIFNRTPQVQTFLWWANVATRVHEHYQSFFPPDVHYVADHAKRAMSEYPLARGHYYGVNYGARARGGIPPCQRPTHFIPPGNYPPNDLGWYANIPVPTSYMAMGSREDFFGGYDHAREAGLVHVANHHIAPGKKQWTWGNQAFGYAWDRNLTDDDGPYIELMAGVYTDNQPDFSFLMPGETRTWSQYWYPIQKIGPAQRATVDLAVSLRVERAQVRLGISAAGVFPGAEVSLSGKGRTLHRWKTDLAPGRPWIETVVLRRGLKATDLRLTVVDGRGRELIAYAPERPRRGVPPAATEPPAPADLASADELFITGLHLEQYRHATRMPEDYWREALRRDPGDARCNLALGRWHLRRGESVAAETHLRRAIARLTLRNPNPSDGEPYYQLGLCLRQQADAECFLNPQSAIRNSKLDEAYAAFYKATWNQAWQAASFQALAEIDCRRHDWPKALDHLERARRLDSDNLQVRALQALVLRQLGREAEARALLRETVRLDPLDWWSRHLLGETLACPTQVRLDLALDCARAGFFAEAIALLEAAVAEPDSGTAPLVRYYLGWLELQRGKKAAARGHFAAAARTEPDYCFPARVEEIGILETASRINPKDPRAPYYLGNLFYDRKRHRDAIRCWERAARLGGFSTVWRNLGIAYYNVAQRPRQARAAYAKAFRLNPGDARLLYESDQLAKRIGESADQRLRLLERHRSLIRQRDDLSVEYCALLNHAGRSREALEILNRRKFQPWEGGEGQALGQYVRTQVALGRQALDQANPALAQHHFESALAAPESLAEARHVLANQSEIYYWLGCAHAARGDRKAARSAWTAAAEFRGDFQEMSVRPFSELTYFSGRALEKLGHPREARKLFLALDAYARRREKSPAKIDYFATSLPTLLLFEDDLQARQAASARLLQAQAQLGLGRPAVAKRVLRRILRRDPSHAVAQDLLAGL